MKKSYYLSILILLMSSSMILSASAQEQVSQTVYVYDGDFNGTLLSGVQVTGQDATGNSFEGITDSNGAAIIYGQPGTWQFTFTKEGYDPLNLNYDVTQAGEGAVYLQRAIQSQDQSQTQAQAQDQTAQTVDQTIYVYDGDFNGTLLSDVQVYGRDAAGNSFEGITDSNGAVVLSGQPGTWQFTFMKEGYDPLTLNYDVTETGEGAVYLQRAAQSQSQEQVESSQMYQQPLPQMTPQQMPAYGS